MHTDTHAESASSGHRQTDKMEDGGRRRGDSVSKLFMRIYGNHSANSLDLHPCVS